MLGNLEKQKIISQRFDSDLPSSKKQKKSPKNTNSFGAEVWSDFAPKTTGEMFRHSWNL